MTLITSYHITFSILHLHYDDIIFMTLILHLHYFTIALYYFHYIIILHLHVILHLNYDL